MKKYIYLLCVLSFVLTACRDDKFGSEESSGSAALKLKFNTSNNMSRAVSSDEEERRIQNAYVFIFNQDGTKVFGRFYDGINQQNTYGASMRRRRSIGTNSPAAVSGRRAVCALLRFAAACNCGHRVFCRNASTPSASGNDASAPAGRTTEFQRQASTV